MNSNPISFGGFELNAGQPRAAAELGPSQRFRILVLADLSGRENCQKNETGSIGKRTVHKIDRDNFDQVLAKIAPQLDRTLLTGEGQHISLKFASLDDFHPDVIFDHVEVFAGLRQLRRQLMNPDLFAQAVETINQWNTADITLDDDDDDEPTGGSAVESNEAAYSTEGLFDQVMESSEDHPDQLEVNWANMIADLVEPYGVAPVDPDRDKYVQLVDEAVQRAMRSLMHHRHFAELEAAWRALFLLVRRLETDAQLSIHVCDVSRTEIAQDLLATDQLDATGLYDKLVEQTVGTAGGEPWTLVVSAHYYDASERGIALLGRLASVCRAAGTTLLTGVGGAPDFWCDPEAVAATAWNQLQSSNGADTAAVCWPRFLARLPYGRRTSPTEQFEFEEIDSGAADELLWGHPAILAALSLGQSFSRAGWNLDPGDVAEQDGMPMYVKGEGVEGELQPCGEFQLTDKLIAQALEQGITPLVSVRGQDRVLYQGMQSVARTPLKGGWS